MSVSKSWKTILITLISIFVIAAFAFAGGGGKAEKEAVEEKAIEKKPEVQINKDVIEKVARMFPNSVLSLEERIKELEWFARAAAPYRGMKISSCAETLPIHEYEAKTLAKAFEEITGIHVTHDIIYEGDIVDRMYTQMATGKPIYDIYVNDTDLIGTHLRRGDLVNLTEFMKGEGADVTDPYLDLNDWMNLDFGMDYDGNILQLPDQQFPSIYIFRYDWFTNPKYKKMFKDKYGYELGVPLNWAAYEDIANFWTNDVGTINGKKVWGHTDYGKKGPGLGWRFSDSWFGIAGIGDLGLPQGVPVDDWGLRTENRIPVGFSVKRGGALNSPCGYYAVQKYIDWIKKYAPPYCLGMGVYELGDNFAKGNFAQQIWMYACFLASPAYRSPESPVTDSEGNPLWRLAPQPHGKYWKEGMKIGYQDCGAWSLPKATDAKKKKAAWLWAQFCVSKTVSVDKFIAGNTPVRKSTVFSDWCTKNLGKRGGLITFYRSPMEKMFTPTYRSVPDYGLLQEQIWHFLAPAIAGEKSVKQAMDELAAQLDMLLSHLYLPKYSPKLAEPKTREYWLNQPGAPWPEIKETPEPRTMDYDKMLEEWKAGRTTF